MIDYIIYNTITMTSATHTHDHCYRLNRQLLHLPI